jgi:hypothetical protein
MRPRKLAARSVVSVSSNELKLGFHRLAERLEDPVTLGVAAAFCWAICAWLIGVSFAMNILQVLLLAIAGVAVILLLRRELVEASLRIRQNHERLERGGHRAA